MLRARKSCANIPGYIGKTVAIDASPVTVASHNKLYAWNDNQHMELLIVGEIRLLHMLNNIYIVGYKCL